MAALVVCRWHDEDDEWPCTDYTAVTEDDIRDKLSKPASAGRKFACDEGCRFSTTQQFADYVQPYLDRNSGDEDDDQRSA